MNRFLRLALTLSACAAPLAFPTKIARAHATLSSSTPANGARVDKSPPFVRLVFTAAIDPKLSRLTLTKSDGLELQLLVEGDQREPRAIQAALPLLSPGTHRVGWHILSADGHPITGSITFSVGDTAAAPTPMDAHRGGQPETMAEPRVGPSALVASLFRGLALSALLALCGLLGFSAYGADRSRRQERLCNWLSVGAPVLFAVHLALWLVHASPDHRLDPAIVGSMLSRDTGLNELLRLVFTALAALAVLARRLRAGFALALAAVIAGGTIGHSATIDPMIAIPMKALHLVGIGFWFGGLLWLVTSDVKSTDAAQVAGTVSSVATISIAVVTITGAVQTFLFLDSWTALVDSLYGIVVLGKISGLMLLAAFGAYHKYRVLPQVSTTDARLLQRSVRREVVLMIAVILAGGLLAYVPIP